MTTSHVSKPDYSATAFLSSVGFRRLVLVLSAAVVFSGCTFGLRARPTVWAYTPPASGTVVYQAPPAPRYVGAQGYAPGAGYTWIDGYWHWDGYQWVWVDGQWSAPRPGYSWRQPTWVRSGRGWVYGGGGWVGVQPAQPQPQPYYPPQRSYPSTSGTVLVNPPQPRGGGAVMVTPPSGASSGGAVMVTPPR